MNWIWKVDFINDIPDVVAQRVIVSAQTAELAIEKVRQQNRGNKIIIIGIMNTVFYDGSLVYNGGL